MAKEGVSVRPAVLRDVKTIFIWRNLQEIVQLSQSQRTVTWEEHVDWFALALKNSQHSIYIIDYHGKNVGLCRFERNMKCCELTIYLIPGQYHKGIGTTAINVCMQNESSKCSKFRAKIRQDNYRSRRFFEKNGFSLLQKNNQIFIYEKNNW